MNYKEEIEELENTIECLKVGKGDLCEICKGTEFGSVSNNTSHYQCEGAYCDETREDLLDSYCDELREVKKKRRKERIEWCVGLSIVGLILYKVVR